ncbi:MAG: hypothetical protein SWZ49_27605 [Cyanobacteriota bacterium]|nr:hypothetical protein [Cyanobacteriota bacterium]
MGVKKLELPKADHAFIGTWHIYEMSEWDEDYFNRSTQAYIEIKPNNLGDFQFGLVIGSLDGYIEKSGAKERFTFTWEGQDEMDEALGSGWIELNGDEEITGLIKLHLGDRSTFQAKRAS